MRAITAALAAIVCVATTQITAAQTTRAQDTVRPVKLITLAEVPEHPTRRFFGRVRARQTVDLAFQVGGQIVAFPVEEGALLNQGELIARLDLERFERAVEEAQLNEDQARRRLERQLRLAETAVAQSQVEDAQTAYDLARLALEKARRDLEKATLRAPFDALIVRRQVANYTTVSAGQSVVRLHDMSELLVDIDIPEVMAHRSADGHIDFRARFPGETAFHPLELREYEAEADSATQSYRLSLAFEETDLPGIMPGASATVEIAGDTDEGGSRIHVPETALVFDAQRRPGLMVFTPSAESDDTGTVSRAPVDISVTDNGQIRLEQGPPVGSEIVVTGASLLEEGQAVRRFSSFEE